MSQAQTRSAESKPGAPQPSASGSALGKRLWAPLAWIDRRWRERVLLEIDQHGRWSAITPDRDPTDDAERLTGPVLPGLVNAHSHAFQRGFAGLTERRDAAHDDFWSWREQMYSLALRISPEQLRAIAAQLYSEMLEGGYTQVCEFHYLHHDHHGQPYADPLAMSRALAEAAADTGIGLTLLPVLYERAGFAQPALSERQRRFKTTVDQVLAMRDAIRAWRMPEVSAGVAIHSLRAASPQSITQLADALAGDPGPIHIHVAEQQAEVRDCVATTGLRPIAWLGAHVAIDSRWHLVHATHADASDIAAVAGTGAGVVICPTTEADLGDGRFDFEGWSERGVPLSIGSDSHVCRQWTQELRLLEYSQRFALERRNVGAAPARGEPSTATNLFAIALAGGTRAAGFGSHPSGLIPGARADAVVLDPNAAGLLAVRPDDLLDAAVFACDSAPIDQVWVAGVRRVSSGRHHRREQFARGFVAAMSGPREP